MFQARPVPPAVSVAAGFDALIAVASVVLLALSPSQTLVTLILVVVAGAALVLLASLLLKGWPNAYFVQLALLMVLAISLCRNGPTVWCLPPLAIFCGLITSSVLHFFQTAPAVLVAYLAGISTMAIEMTASRLLAPSFGTSLAVWTNIIGVMMVALCAGYTIGGRLADRRPEAGVLSAAILASGLWAAIVPAVSGPVLRLTVETIGVEEFTGSFLGTLVLFAPPIFLLGMVNPFAIRLAGSDVESVGQLSGRVYSVSTLGSLLGTFLPVLLTIPMLGTAKTMYLFSVLLILTGLLAGKLAGRDSKAG